MWKKRFFILKRSNKPVRLDKKISLKEKIQKWFNKHKMPFVIAGIVVALIIFVVLMIKFAPGTESGNWYNGLRGVI